MAKKIERQLQGVLATVFSEVIRERKLESRVKPYLTQEEGRADITLKDDKNKPVLFVELKDPTAKDGRSIYDHAVFGRESLRARRLKIRNFGICNFIDGNLIDINNEFDDQILEEGRLFNHSELDRLRTKFEITPAVRSKLATLANWYVDRSIEILDGKKPKTKAVDELFIYRIKSLIQGYNIDVSYSVWKKFEKNKSFKAELQNYAKAQQWSATIITSQTEIENFTYLSLLLLVTKLVFYKALFDFKVWDLPKLAIPESITSCQQLEKYLWDDTLDSLVEATGDFELLIGKKTEFINSLPFESEHVVDFVKDIVFAESRYDFSKISYDIVGRIFEELIRDDDRHKRGQYFTPTPVVDLINAFCIREGNERVLDPSCGSGTFLVRAYERKKRLAKHSHNALLSELHGIDISPYASHLAMLNIVMRDLRAKSYPRVICRDFFDIDNRHVEHIQSGEHRSEAVKLYDFDAIVGNPPYTQQEEIEDFTEGQKNKINTKIYKDWKIEPSNRTSIYGHFFYHAGALLKDGGMFGFITENSWLDTSYGKEIQKWMLSHFAISAIIDTKVERFFPSASVNTNISILRRETNKESRDNNIVRFVYFKTMLANLYNRFDTSDGIRKFIESKKKNYEDDDIRIVTVPQKQLVDEESWTLLLTAPDIYRDIVSTGRKTWKTLNEGIATVKRGFTTGVNEFFYFKDITDSLGEGQYRVVRNNFGKIETRKEVERKKLRIINTRSNELWFIEEQFVHPIIKSPQEITKYAVDVKSLKMKILLANEQPAEVRESYPYLWRYIKDGERNGFNKVKTTSSRPRWYSLGEWEPADALWFASYNERFVIAKSGGVLEDKRLFGITFTEKKQTDFILGLLNSSLFPLFYELGSRRNLGEGATEWAVYEVQKYKIPYHIPAAYKSKIAVAYKKLSKEPVQSIFEEIGARKPEDVSIKNILPSRLQLDEIVFEAIGYTKPVERKKVLLELYRSIIDLVSSRLEKAKSVESKKSRGKKTETDLYLKELRSKLKDKGINIKRNISFVRELKSIAKEVTDDKKLHSQLVSLILKEEFGVIIDKKSLAKESQEDLFV